MFICACIQGELKDSASKNAATGAEIIGICIFCMLVLVSVMHVGAGVSVAICAGVGVPIESRCWCQYCFQCRCWCQYCVWVLVSVLLSV